MKVKKFYIETYGCQMNVADSEVVAAILEDKGYQRTQEKSEADVILVNTCSVRENAEQRVRGRVQGFSEVKKKNPHVLVAIKKRKKARKPSILNYLPRKPIKTSALPGSTKQPFQDSSPSCGDVIISAPIVSFPIREAVNVAEVPEVSLTKYWISNPKVIKKLHCSVKM